MTNRLQLCIDSSLPEIGRVHDEFSALAARRGLSPTVENAFQVAFEEVLINIITHGFQNRPGQKIWLEIRADAKEIRAVIEDSAPLFNPLQAPGPDLTTPVEER